MRGLITQSNYIPWKGYFDNIAYCDVMVVYDDMQYTKRDWRNRNYIKTAEGLQWLTIPVNVSGKYHQKINETTVSDAQWSLQHFHKIVHHYRNCAAYSEMKVWLEQLYRNTSSEYLTHINVQMIKSINELLGIGTTLIDSREVDLFGEKTERLVNVCKQLGITEYCTGPAAKSYMDESIFANAGIKVHYFDYSGYKEYPQQFMPFEHGVSILDLILNTGDKAKTFLKFAQ